MVKVVVKYCPIRERKPHVRRAAVALMKPGVVIINTSRGALVRASVRACVRTSGQIYWSN